MKGGVHIQSKDIDALLGAMDKHKCELGVFLTIAEPTKANARYDCKFGLHRNSRFQNSKTSNSNIRRLLQEKASKACQSITSHSKLRS